MSTVVGLLRTAGGVTALLAGVLVLPTLAGALLLKSWNELLKYLPSKAGPAFTFPFRPIRGAGARCAGGARFRDPRDRAPLLHSGQLLCSGP